MEKTNITGSIFSIITSARALAVDTEEAVKALPKEGGLTEDQLWQLRDFLHILLGEFAAIEVEAGMLESLLAESTG